MTSDRTFLWTVSLLGGAFLLSLTLYLLVPGSLTRTVLQFPEEVGGRVAPEVRSLPFGWDREHNVELVVREVLLGPARHNHLRLFSRKAEVRSVLVRGAKVYVDLTKGAFIPDADVIYSPVKALEVLKATLKANFADVSEINISVDGEPVVVNNVDKG